MGDKDNGGSAFPEIFTAHKWSDKHSDFMQDTYSAGGMTLRDYFAAKALAGFCAAPDERVINGGTVEEVEERRRIWARNDAEAAYRLADAMMKARKA